VTGRLRKELKVPLITSNRINMPDVAEAVLARGDADLISMARPMLADPELMLKTREGREDEINTCIACNQACLDHTFTGRLTSCLVNPRACNETLLNYEPAVSPKTIAVVGAGPAGLAYATVAADLASNQTVANEAADAQIAPWTTIVEGGQVIGVLGLTTQVLASISTINGVQVLDPNGDGGVDNMAELAAILQPYVDQMAAQGINKIVLLSHLQQFNNELNLAPLLRGVDVIISAGSHAIFADGTDALRQGDTASAGYPVYRTGADGRPVAIVSTSGEYSYVGRLVVTFDSNGVLIADPDGAGA
jgi:tRNA-dihydrouridine synthase